MSSKLLQLKQMITFSNSVEDEQPLSSPVVDRLEVEDQALTNAEQALQTSINTTKQLIEQKCDLFQAYQQIKQDYNAQNQRIHDIENQISELSSLKQLMDDLPDLTNDYSLENIQQGLLLFDQLNVVFKQDFKPSSAMQKQILNLTNTQSYIQQLIDQLHVGCELYLSQQHQKVFSEELLFISELQNNQFAAECKSTLVYDIIDFYFQKFTEILPKISGRAPLFELQKLLPRFPALNLLHLQNSLFVPNDLFSMFGMRVIKVAKQQFDIRFMGSPQFDKGRQSSVQQIAKRWTRLFAAYLEQLFGLLMLEQLFDKQVVLSSELLVGAKKAKVEATGFAKVLQVGVEYLYKKPKQVLVGEILTSCKNQQIKECFMRKYDEAEIGKETLQQVVVDQIVMIVYKFLEQIEFVLGWKWADVETYLYDELIVGLEGSVCKELIGQVVQSVIYKMK